MVVCRVLLIFVCDHRIIRAGAGARILLVLLGPLFFLLSLLLVMLGLAFGLAFRLRPRLTLGLGLGLALRLRL